MKTDERASRKNFEKLNRQGMSLQEPININKKNCGMKTSQMKSFAKIGTE